MADAFISYSRRDAVFVEGLAAALEGRGKTVWLDTEGIEAGEVFPLALQRAIEGSDAFVFVITPDSVASRFCTQEIEHAQTLGKRILPVLRIKVPDEALHAEIRDRNWISFESDDDSEGALDRMVAALDSDLEHAKAHTHWLVKSLNWESHGRDKSFLLRGSELASAEVWLASVKVGAQPEPTALQRAYVYASRGASSRRQRMVVGASLVAVIVAGTLAVTALISRSQARHSAAVAVRAATTAEAQRLGAQALTVTPPDQSFLYARESYNLEPSPATRGYLFAAQARAPAAMAVVTPVRERIRGSVSSPDRRSQLVINNLNEVAVLDSGTLKVERRFAVAQGGVYAWAGSSHVLYEDAASHKLGLLDLRTGRFRPDPRLPATAYSVSANGKLLYTLPLSGTSIDVVDLRTMRLERTLRPANGLIFTDVEPQQGGTVVAVEAPLDPSHGRTRYAIWLHDFAGAPSLVVRGAPGFPPFVPYTVGGGRLALPWTQGVRLVDLSTGKASVIDPDIGALSTLGLSPDGRTLVIATLIHSGVTVVRVPDGSPLDSLVGHQSQVHGVTFNPSGSVVYTGGADGRLIAWDLRGTRSLAATTKLPGPGPAQNESFPDGRYITATRNGRVTAAVNGDGTLQIVASRARGLPIVRSIVVAPPGAKGQPFSVAFDPAGRLLAVGTDDAHVLIYATSTWRIVKQLIVPADVGPRPPIVSLAFSPDGQMVAVAAADGRILRFRVPSGHRLAPIAAIRPAAADSTPALAAIAYSPDGSQIAAAVTAPGGGVVTVFDSSTGMHEYSVRDGYLASAVTFTPDGRTLITGDGEGFARFWNARTGRTEGAPIRADEGTVNSLAVDTTGATLLAAGSDGATWLFDLKSRTQIGTPLGADPNTTTAALFVGSGDGSPLSFATPNILSGASLTRWDLKARYLAARACNVARRNLTPLEWEQVLPNLPYTKVCHGFHVPPVS